LSFLKLHKLKKIDSTNSEAAKLARRGGEGCVVAKKQTKGRGRHERKWHSEVGNLYCSLYLRPDIKPTFAPQLTFVMALAAKELLEKYLDEPIQLKWPNDVYVMKRKILGILNEAEVEGDKLAFVVLGIGINVNQPNFPKEISDIAVSMQQITQKDHDLDELLASFLAIFERWYKKYLREGFQNIKTTWENQSGFIGRHVVVQDNDQKIEGKVKSLDENGALVISSNDGKVQTVFAGDLICF